MGFKDLLRVIARRWYIVVPIVLAGLVAGGYMMATERTLYRSDLAVTLVADPTPGQETSLRQFWDQNGARIAPALGEAMIEELRSPEVQKAVGQGRTSGKVDAEPGSGNSFAVNIEDGEYLYRLSAWAYEAGASAGAVEDAAAQAASAVQRLQKNAGAPADASHRVVTVGSVATQPASASRSVRMPLAVVAASLMAGLLLGVLVDGFARRRAREE